MKSLGVTLVSLVLVTHTLDAQQPADPVISAQGPEKIGEWIGNQGPFLTSCTDFLDASDAERRWYISGMNQALYYAVGVIGFEKEMPLMTKAARGDAVGDSASLRLQGAKAARAAVNQLLPATAQSVGKMTNEVEERCAEADDTSHPVGRFFREAIRDGRK